MLKNKNYLKNAIALKNRKNNVEALDNFEKAYRDNPESFTRSDRTDYAWTIYRVKIRKNNDIDELCENAELVTSLVLQRDLTRTAQKCPYTLAVFRVLSCLVRKKDFTHMIHWIEKINPDFLDIVPYSQGDTLKKSKREAFLDWATNAYLKTYDYENCIIMAKKALRSFDTFTGNGEAWFRYRLGKSLYELNRLDEALEYYIGAEEVLHYWYIYNDIANIYCRLRNPRKAQEYLCPVILSSEPADYKAFIYYTCYNVFRDTNPDVALKHAGLFYLLMREANRPVPYEIEKMDFDENSMNRSELEAEITGLWVQYRKYLDKKDCQDIEGVPEMASGG